jgi:PAS domain-containing protein
MLEAQGEASIDGIIVVADDGTVLLHNARFAEMWGIEPSIFQSQRVVPLRSALLERVRDSMSLTVSCAASVPDL